MILMNLLHICTCMRAHTGYYQHECWSVLLAEVELIKQRMNEKVRNCAQAHSWILKCACNWKGRPLIGPVYFLAGGEAEDSKCSTDRRPGRDRTPNPEIQLHKVGHQ